MPEAQPAGFDVLTGALTDRVSGRWAAASMVAGAVGISSQPSHGRRRHGPALVSTTSRLAVGATLGEARSYFGSRVPRVPRGKPSPKLAITVDADVHAQVVTAAAAQGVSVSAWMTEAARRALVVRDGLRALADWEAEHGALTDAELAAARRRVAAELTTTGGRRSS